MADKEALARLPANLQVNSNPLFSFDLNFDSLKVFLDKMSNTINQHAELINALSVEVQTREMRKVLPEQLNIISEGGKIMDNNMANIIKNQIAKSVRAENTGDNLQNATNKIFNKLTALGYAAAYNYNTNLEYPPRFTALEKEMAKKANKDEVKEKHTNLKQKVANDIEDIKKYFEKKITDLDNKYATKINTFEDKIQSVEKKTLWKIQDCEEMLKKRITEDYVDDSCKTLEDKIKREVLTLAQSDSEKIERISAEILSRMKIIEDSQVEKLKSVKKSIKDVEDLVNGSCTKQGVFEEFKKNMNIALQELQKKQKELEKSQDLMPILERQNIRIKSIDDKLNDLAETSAQRIQEVMNQMSNYAYNSKKGNGGEISQIPSNLDPHKLCQIESDLNRAIEDLKKQQVDIDNIKNKVLVKLENIDLSVYEAGMNGNRSSNTNNIRPSNNEGLDQLRQQMIEMMNNQPNSNIDEDRLKRMQSEIKEIQKKMESVRDLEKRLQRIFKEFDLSNMSKQLKSKAESDDVLKDFAIVDTKVNTNSEQISYCRKDIDNLILLYKKLLQALQSNNNNTGDLNSIITTKKLHPVNQLNCLSCGVPKNNLSYSHNHYPGRGIDGRNYKVDQTMVNESMQQQQLIDSRHATHSTSTPNFMPHSQKLQRPSTATVRNESQQLQVSNSSAVQQQSQNRNTLQINNSQHSKRQLRPESAKK